MKVLVTGSTGFIGSHLCKALLAKGHQVRAFHRPNSNTQQLEGLAVEHVTGDLTKPETLAPAVDGMEVVFHAAAMLGGQGDLGRMYTVTVEGTREILQAARNAGVKRFVHTSSAAALGIPESVAGREPEPVLLDEAHTWNASARRWPYAYAKYLSELEVQQAVFAGLDAVILNPTIVYGAGDLYRQSRSTIVQVARQKIPAYPRGGSNLVHIQDVVDGHLAALDFGKTGERYLLGGLNMTHETMLKMIASVVGKPAPQSEMPTWLLRAAARPAVLLKSVLPLPIQPEVLSMAGLYFYYGTSKAERVLHLPQPRPVIDAIREAYDWFRKIGALEI